ncbi:hypothetical protein CK507_10130 [Pseudomonas sp. WN033]|nr:hypothetical protein CK507_10130 [Pseudomonas sp. WN033]
MDKPQQPAIIDLDEARRERIHDIHEARLQQVRSAFEQAFPLKNKPAKPARGKKKSRKR